MSDASPQLTAYRKHGFNSRAAFLRATGVPVATFEILATDPSWWVAKGALLHAECPDWIRDRFVQSPVWYQRFVAMLASKAAARYLELAKDDPDRRIKAAYQRRTALVLPEGAYRSESV